MALINAVRADAPPVAVIEVINPGITPEELAGKFIVLELSKAERLQARPSEPHSAFDAWVAFFIHWNKEEIMSTITHEPVKQALAELQRLSGDEDSRRAAFVRERALRDERSALQAAKQEGRQEGRREANIEMALKMIAAKRFDDASIAEFSGLTEDEVRQLREQA